MKPTVLISARDVDDLSEVYLTFMAACRYEVEVAGDGLKKLPYGLTDRQERVSSAVATGQAVARSPARDSALSELIIG